MFYMSVVLSNSGFAENRVALVVASLAAIWIALGTNLVGVGIGKWTENLGASASWILGVLLMVAAALVWRRHGSATAFHLTPDFSWDTVSFGAAILYAMTGLENIGFMGGEIRDPHRNLPRAAWISSMFATLFYAGATTALLVILRHGEISELNDGLAQTGTAAGQILGAPWLSRAIVILVLATAIGQFGGLGAAASRLPFVAGVDHLFPAAFAKIHSRRNTPYIAIIALGVLVSGLLVSIQFGDTLRAAYQTLVSLMVIAGFLPFLYLFGSAWIAGKRWSAAFGIGMTLLAIVCSVIPTGEIHNVRLFEFKLAGGTVAMVAAGWLVYQRYRKPTG
jgi:amino acid transporter